MERLVRIGFERAGEWRLQDSNILLCLDAMKEAKSALYAFVVYGEIKYIGKTRDRLNKRLTGYQRPGNSQSTNIRVGRNIKKELESGGAVEIYVLADIGLNRYGDFHLNIAAGLEDSLIDSICPAWNGVERAGGVSNGDRGKISLATNTILFPITFRKVLHKAYYQSGFFNVAISHEKYFGDDGREIEILIGDEIVNGEINRRANNNYTPRIMGGKALKRWFVSNFDRMDEIQVEVINPYKIKLKHTDN